ncbi:PAS domain S-box protein [Phenylobacterium sp. LjRoot219]|uniref:sensor histidine kinase n=1 Tax=Phenylobacterium sp. LjRoot219 TaxID=3342283 RepID=UPI003ECDB9DE
MSLTTDPATGVAVQAQERAREIVDGLGEGFLSVDADWRLTDCNAAAEQLLGCAREDILGLKLWGIAGLPSDSAFAELARRVAGRRAAEEAELGLRVRGRSRVLSVRAFPLAGGVGVVWRDITQVRAAERRMALSEARYHEIADETPAAAWLSRADGKLEFVNQAMADALGRPARELLGEGWMEALDPEDRAGLLLTRTHARATQSAASYEARFRRPDGEVRILQLYWRPRFDRSGAFRGHVGSGADVTEVRAAEKRHRTLINELNHRVKNTLATVQSLVSQTLREHGVAREVEAAVSERLIGLATGHDVLTRENWRGAELSEITKETTRAYNHGGCIALTGPKVRISPRTAIALSMALNELATNAVKYGALSRPDGRVQLTWERTGATATLEWRESGGPPVSEPPRTGFGARLFGKVLAGELGEPAELTYAPEGLVCRIRAPVDGPPEAEA